MLNCEMYVIGFHLNATVRINTGDRYSVSISFDRRRITSCICTCKAVPLWCCHIVAVCLLRIYNVSDTLLFCHYLFIGEIFIHSD